MQLGLFDAFVDLLFVSPVFLFGALAICALLAAMFRENKAAPKAKTSILLLALYCYLCILLTNVVGLPSLSEFARLLGLGGSLFNPNVNLVPLSEGLSIGFVLNILLFVPLGFLCPLISKSYRNAKSVLLLGGGLSAAIEVAQLFTLYRATDVNDLIANVAGTLVGYACFILVRKLTAVKSYSTCGFAEPPGMRYAPIATIVIAFVLAFFR